jgi:hypothetical protein
MPQSKKASAVALALSGAYLTLVNRQTTISEAPTYFANRRSQVVIAQGG